MVYCEPWALTSANELMNAGHFAGEGGADGLVRSVMRLQCKPLKNVSYETFLSCTSPIIDISL